jgi:hypothetical protein
VTNREPFVTSWWAIALQLVSSLWLMGLSIYVWRHCL